jgi:cystathionine beta-lyase/cystathionine gamma-synthase
MSTAKLPRELSPATLCVHAGHRAHPGNAAVVAPIVQSTTFLLDDRSYANMLAGRVDEALIYTRLGNPTLDAVERKIAALEGAEEAYVLASGMAAIHAAVMSLVQSGSRILAHRELYGSTWDLFRNFLPRLGITTSFVDLGDERALAAALREKPAVVYCESISNPTMNVSDIPKIARAAHAAGARVVVDATFATPILQRPLALGADLVAHSATKYLGGHSDLIGGAVCGSKELMRPVFRWLQLAGGCMDPHAAYLLDRGIKTLPLRMRAHAAVAQRVAERLEQHPRVKRVLYPGLASHPSHELARSLLALPGGMMGLVIDGGDEAALRSVRKLKVAIEASSLGGVETLVSLPFNTSHVKLSAGEREAAGIAPGFVRVSIGIEDADDLIADFEQSLEA